MEYRKMKNRMTDIIFIMISALIFGGELVLKTHIEENEESGKIRHILGDRILVRKYHNEGACLNVGEKKRGIVAGLSLLLTGVLTVVFAMTLGTCGNTWLKAGLSILLGGAFSNTYDRLKRKYVVDYFSFHVKWEPLRRVVFNLSDFCILIGALVIALRG